MTWSGLAAPASVRVIDFTPNFAGRTMLATVERPVVKERATIRGISLKIKEAHTYRRRTPMGGDQYEESLRGLGLPARCLVRSQHEKAVA